MKSNSVFEYSEQLLSLVQKDFFFDGFQLNTDVFLKISNSKFLVIGKAGTRAFFSQYKSYLNENSEIFILKSELLNFTNAVTHFTENIISIKNIPNQMKVKFLRGLVQVSMEQLEKKEITSSEQLKKTAEVLISFSAAINSFSEITDLLNQLPQDESCQLVTTCLLALAICEDLGISQKPVMKRVAIASLVHDIGLKLIPKRILEKPNSEWSLDEILIYESHPLKAVEQLRVMKDMTNDILMMVAQHHENAIGTGFPNRIRDVSTSPLAKILIVAAFFSDLLRMQTNANQNMTAVMAIDYIEKTLSQPFNKQVFSSLKKIVGF